MYTQRVNIQDLLTVHLCRQRLTGFYAFLPSDTSFHISGHRYIKHSIIFVVTKFINLKTLSFLSMNTFIPIIIWVSIISLKFEFTFAVGSAILSNYILIII